MNQHFRRKLRALEQSLIAAPRIKPFASTSWVKEAPAAPGVYAIWRVSSGEVIYVGETADLRQRMRDLGRFPNHTARKKIAAELGFGPEDEDRISVAMSAAYRVSWVEVPFGRVELEEYLTFRMRNTLINSPSPRAHTSRRFAWAIR